MPASLHSIARAFHDPESFAGINDPELNFVVTIMRPPPDPTITRDPSFDAVCAINQAKMKRIESAIKYVAGSPADVTWGKALGSFVSSLEKMEPSKKSAEMLCHMYALTNKPIAPLPDPVAQQLRSCPPNETLGTASAWGALINFAKTFNAGWISIPDNSPDYAPLLHACQQLPKGAGMIKGLATHIVRGSPERILKHFPSLIESISKLHPPDHAELLLPIDTGLSATNTGQSLSIGRAFALAGRGGFAMLSRFVQNTPSHFLPRVCEGFRSEAKKHPLPPDVTDVLPLALSEHKDAHARISALVTQQNTTSTLLDHIEQTNMKTPYFQFPTKDLRRMLTFFVTAHKKMPDGFFAGLIDTECDPNILYEIAGTDESNAVCKTLVSETLEARTGNARAYALLTSQQTADFFQQDFIAKTESPTIDTFKKCLEEDLQSSHCPGSVLAVSHPIRSILSRMEIPFPIHARMSPPMAPHSLKCLTFLEEVTETLERQNPMYSPDPDTSGGIHHRHTALQARAIKFTQGGSDAPKPSLPLAMDYEQLETRKAAEGQSIA